MVWVNLKAFIATDPSEVAIAHARGVDVGGAHNRECIEWALSQGGCQVVVAWGANGKELSLDVLTLKLIRLSQLMTVCLGTTKDGFPRHPLRLSYNTKLVPFARGA